MSEFTEIVIEIISSIPSGKVATYGQIARLAGAPRSARQVVRVLNTQTRKHNLPWHRVINSKGEIAITDEYGADQQASLLISEGVAVSDKLKVDLEQYQWEGTP